MRRLVSCALVALSLVVALRDDEASANSFDFIGIHQMSVNTVSPIDHTSLPFSSSATGVGPGGLEPFGDFSGDQLSPFQLRFAGTLRNGASASTESTISFTLDTATIVSMSGWATLFDGDGSGPATFDARVTSYAPLTNELIFFTTASGTWMFDQSVWFRLNCQ